MNRIPDSWPAHGEAEVAAPPVVLAHEAPFALPPLHVEPALRRMVRDDGAETIVEPLVMQVLVALARADGDILTRDELVDRCWDGRIVGDDSIARVIGMLRKLGAEFGQGAFAIETITKVGYRLLAAGADGAQRDKDEAVVTRASFKARSRVAGLVAAAGLAAAAAAVWAFALPGDVAQTSTTISVEPVTSTVPDQAARRFANDLTNDFARLAGAMSNLKVIDRDAGGGSAESNYVLRISVESEGQRLAARARLVGAGDGAVLWSRTFVDKSGSDATLREQVAVSAAGVMRCGLEHSAAALSGDPVSLRLFLAACDASQDEDWARAESFARQVVARRPEVAAGWACLALAMSNAQYADAKQSPAQAAAKLEAARGYARKAIRLEPDDGRGYFALVLVEEAAQGHPSAIAVIERGIAADPDYPNLYNAYGNALFNAGYVKAGVAPALRAVALDPTSLWAHGIAVRRLLAAGRTDEAFAMQAKSERLWPSHPQVVAQRLRLAVDYEDPAVALALIEREELQGTGERNLPVLARVYVKWRADPASLDRARLDREAEAEVRDGPSVAWFVVGAMIRMGETDRAFAWLARAPVTEAQNQWSLLFWPHAAPLRRDPRFFAAMARLGLVDLWVKRGQWPDFCSEPGLRYDCRREAARLARKPAAT